ncbi:DNA methyltransferase [Nocardia sp. NPDC049220]|uniref:Eco57I restriction-modification methylase domain-containing protein n=1 Tax=Nocardia sp. NPDC049220 TaxID=3155273 RepID=UPI0033F0BB01
MSASSRAQAFSAIHSVGGLIPPEMLDRISEGRKEVGGCDPADYDVVGARSVRDDAERHWDFLKAIWFELRKQLSPAPEATVPADPSGIATKQWLEPLFSALGFGKLAIVGANGIPADDGQKTFPISHHWNHVPIHFVAWNQKLDKRSIGASTVPPQSLLQECLNCTEAQLWGIVTNGRQLRLLRDSSSFATASYVDFDLEAIFDGELFNEFVLLYRLLHVTRFAVADGAPPSSCWLERWRAAAIESGMRALDQYRVAVEKAITALGTGFLQHTHNDEALRNLDVYAYRDALLRLVYRMICLFVIEDRNLLHPSDTPGQARERYRRYFSTARLREQARRRGGNGHTDLYRALAIVLEALRDESGRPELGLPGLGGLFDDTPVDKPLHGLKIANRHLLEAIRALSRVWDADSARWRAADYRNMGSEELGSVYESLLERVPQHSAVDRTISFVAKLGNERKKTGSYYTRTSLIKPLLDSALDPAIEDAQQRGLAKSEAANKTDPTETIVAELLSLTVCDPACGSGHFLVAAARRIAKRIASIRENHPEPSEGAVRHALHEVVARCLYGVDINPMAVELAKVSLWIEAMEPGKAMGFLDAHIKVGNSLIGATPALLRDGIPETAFKVVEGDDRKVADFYKDQNQKARDGQASLFDLHTVPKVGNTTFATNARRITNAPADNVTQVRKQAAAYGALASDTAYRHALHVADAWCAAFLWRYTINTPEPVTHDVFLDLQDPEGSAASKATHDEIVRLRDQYTFFHWHLEFPEVFTVSDDDDTGSPTGWSGGFSCVLANPPWDKLDLEDKKYFSIVEPSIAKLSGSTRRQRIVQWINDVPEEGHRYLDARRMVKATLKFTSSSGVFPLAGRGLSVPGVNSLWTDHLFVERFTSILAPDGRVGCVVPTTLATNAGAQHLFQRLSSHGSISMLLDFENRNLLFESVHASYKFCLLSLVGPSLSEASVRLAFFLLDPAELDDPNRVIDLAPEEITLANPNTGNLPIFRSRRDADITLSIYRRIPVMWDETRRSGNPWNITTRNLFNITDDDDIFRKKGELLDDGWVLHGNVFIRDGKRMLPFFEGKMIHHFDHRWSSFYGTGDNDRRRFELREKADPSALVMPRNWVAEEGVVRVVRRGRERDIPGVDLRLRKLGWEREWICGFRDVCRSTDERTTIAAFVPKSATGDKLPLILPAVSSKLCAALMAALSSLVFDYVSRQKIGSANMAVFVMKQLPMPAPSDLQYHTEFLTPRMLELVYTTYDLAPLARDLGDSEDTGPFQWDEDRRAIIRAELDAYFFLLYGIGRDVADYILETFQSESGGGLKNNEIAKYGIYRTKELVLSAYDRMSPLGVDLAHPLVDGENYQSPLNPPPGDGPRRPCMDLPAEMRN